MAEGGWAQGSALRELTSNTPRRLFQPQRDSAQSAPPKSRRPKEDPAADSPCCRRCQNATGETERRLARAEAELSKKDKALMLNSERLVVLQTTVGCWKKRLEEESRVLERERSVQQATLEIKEGRVQAHMKRAQHLEKQLQVANKHIQNRGLLLKEGEAAKQIEAVRAAAAIASNAEAVQELDAARRQLQLQTAMTLHYKTALAEVH